MLYNVWKKMGIRACGWLTLFPLQFRLLRLAIHGGILPVIESHDTSISVAWEMYKILAICLCTLFFNEQVFYPSHRQCFAKHYVVILTHQFCLSG